MAQEALEEGSSSPPYTLSLFKEVGHRTNWFVSLQAVIFVDNSGADIILGILPFAREMLRQGMQVILFKDIVISSFS